MYLIHHGRKGQQWGVTNGPPYPLGTTNKGYKIKQAINNGAKKFGKFMYDRFGEYGKDHQAVRDKYVENYKRKGYNETASQILAEQQYQREDKAFVKAALLGTAAVTAIPFSIMGVTAAGGMSAIKIAAGKKMTEAMIGLMSNLDLSSIATGAIKSQITPELIEAASKAIR